MNSSQSGADVLAQTLKGLGADIVFGLPGTQNVPTFEAFRRAGLRTVLCVHEVGASFMANGFARASGRVGVIATIPGPGFLYAFPGLAEARLDSVPLLHVVGQPPSGPGGRFLHQAIPQERMVRSLVKEVVSVDCADDMREAVERAWTIALAGEPGPVVLHVAAVAQSGVASRGVPRERAEGTVDGGVDRHVEQVVRQAAARLACAERPIVFLGQGAADAGEVVSALVEHLGALTFSTPSGRGVLPENHRLCLGFDPDRGSIDVLNKLLGDADVVLALGCRMGFNGTAGFRLDLPASKLIHVNTDAEALDGMRPADLPILGRVEVVVPQLLEILGRRVPRGWPEGSASEWRERLTAGHDSGPVEPAIHGVPRGEPKALFDALRRVLPDDGIVVTDAGLHQVLVRRHFQVLSPRGLILPADFQSMGFGLPAALGARLAAPRRPVVAVVGDGGMAMSAMEMLTAAREGIPVVVLVLNDGYLNLIRLQQASDNGVTHAVSLQNPDFRVLADACGAGYALLDDQPDETLSWALAQPGPVLVEVLVRDSRAIHKIRVGGAARRAVREVVGPRILNYVKRFLSRS